MTKEELLSRANSGDVTAVEEVANSYYRGLNGFEEDNDLAYAWFLKSEKLNSKGVITLNGLGGCYYFGYGTEVNQEKGLAYYRKAAELGYKNAQYNLADKLDKNGNPECVFWYTKAAEQDYGDALYRLFEMYRDGEMVEQDYDKAVWCLERGAQVKFIDAMLTLGYQYGNGDGSLVPKDKDKALYWELAAANEGSSTAMSNLAINYRIGDIVDANIDTAIEWAKRASENGEGEQLFYIAVEYEKGEGREQDIAKAYALYEFAAEHGHARSMIQLALRELRSSEKFSEVKPDEARASLEWAKKAAVLGNENGFSLILHMANIAYGEEKAKQIYFEAAKEGADNGYYYCMFEAFRCYRQGYGTEANQDKALEYLQRAANGEWPQALLELANLETDEVKAFELYKRAAEKGCVDAYDDLGECYRNGKGTRQDLNAAIAWHKKAVDEGNNFLSAFALGTMYKDGLGVDQDIKLAIDYHEKAYEFGKKQSPDNPAVLIIATALDNLYSNEQLEDFIDSKSAKQFYSEKANAGDPRAMYEMGRFSEGNVAFGGEAVTWLEMAANAGSAQAQFRLGLEYMLNDNDVEAGKYYEMGAAQDHPGCLIYMGNYLYCGSQNISQDSVKAYNYFCRAANQGNALANYKKGICCMLGRGTPQNKSEAFVSFKKAQELGCEEMWSELGECYLEGIGTDIDMQQAMHCFHQGADGKTKCPYCAWKLGLVYAGTYDQNQFDLPLAERYLKIWADGDDDQHKADAQFVLGLAYDHVGNTQQALKRWEQAASNGSSSAQYNIGVMYFNGQQVPKDLNKALRYFQLAAAQGHEDAIQAVQDIKDIQTRQSQAQQQQSNQSYSSQSRQGSTGGCYIATCVYGSYDCPEVWTLRRYRDYTLAQTWWGRLFIKAYYFVSPKAVRAFGKYNWFQCLWKNKLDGFVKKLQEEGFESTPYHDK